MGVRLGGILANNGVAMAKKTSSDLLADLESLPDYQGRQNNYFGKLKTQKPDIYSQVIEVIQSHLSGGPICKKIPTQLGLYRELKARGIIDVQQSTFTHFYCRVRDGQV